MTGCLRLATNEDRWTEYRRLATTARSFGMDMELVSPAEVKRMWPLMEVGDLVGASWLPTDGQASPSDITQSLAKGARMARREVLRGRRASPASRWTATASPRCTPPTARCSARPWSTAPASGRGRSARWPASTCRCRPVKHQYIVTEKIEGLALRRADHPRSRPPHLLQGRGRRPRDGRLRAEPDRLDHRRRSRRLPVPASSTTTGTISSST